MKIRQILAVVALLVAMTTTSGLMQGIPDVQDVEPHYFCGRTLARVLAYFCYDADFDEDKRSGKITNSLLPRYFEDMEPVIKLPWLGSHKARGMNLHSRGKRNVVAECCEKPCTLPELMMYC